jgi:EAL domain-containing protein (putative c-di-GMP-specific phosphodiesterase class I)/GGDEF domain-containing protein
MHRMTMTTQQQIDTPKWLHLAETQALDALGNITRLAAQVFGLPVAAISLTDDTCQWLRAISGPDPSPFPPPLPTMTPRAGSPCFRVAETAECLAVPDLATHQEFQSGLLATLGMRCYAGAPLLDPKGDAIGALCIMGPDPRSIPPERLTLLRDLAVLAMDAVTIHLAARVDPMSGLPNRRHLLEELASLPPGQPRQFALLEFADPDERAHMLRTVGSVCLNEKVHNDARALHTVLTPAARMFHLAPAQFAFLAPPGIDPGDLAARLHAELFRNRQSRGALFPKTCTVGLATFIPGHTDPVEMLRQANTALDDARAKGRPSGVYMARQDIRFRRAFTLLNDFATALTPAAQNQRSGLHLAYQPRLELATGRCVGVEALLRWTHPTLGEIPTVEFIHLIERTTLARGLMHWVLEAALAQLAEWRNSGIRIQLSVNVFPANLEDDDFSAHVLQALEAARVPPDALELEVTESALLDEAGPSLCQLATLAQAGISIAIDDFGTGYSSLSYLQRLPANVVKIDQSFIRPLSKRDAKEGRPRTLVAAMIALSHGLGFRVVAEGLESQDTADLLLSLNCDEGQGYWFGRPMSASAFESWLAKRPWTPNPCWATQPVASRRIISA